MSHQIQVDPIDEPVPYDILEGQQIVYEPKPQWNIDIDKNIEKIWQTPKLKFENLTFSNVEELFSKDKQNATDNIPEQTAESQLKSTDNQKDEVANENLEQDPQDNVPEYDEKKFYELKHSMSQSIELAHVEMGVALDALTLILSNSEQQVSADQPLPVPPGSITLTGANKPRAGHRALIHQSKLNLGAKQTQLTLASSLLRSGATRLSKTIEVENNFWDQILQLSRLNWFIQKVESKNEKDPTQYYIDYGFAGSGSAFYENTYAFIDREVDGKLNLVLKFEVEKVISVRLQPTNKDAELPKDTPIPIVPEGVYLPEKMISSNLPTDPQVLSAHEKLCKARSTALETELFNYLTIESKSISQCTHNISGSVYVSINDDWELVFELKELPQPEPLASTHLHWLCNTIKTTLLFKLREYHKHLDWVKNHLLHTHDSLAVDEIKRTIPVFQDHQFIKYTKEMVLYYFFLQEIDQVVEGVLDHFRSVSSICESFSSKSFFKIQYSPIEDIKTHQTVLGHSLLINIGSSKAINIELRAPNTILLGMIEGQFSVETPNQLKDLLIKKIQVILYGLY